MKSWRKRFSQFRWFTDEKPKGKYARYLEKQNRQDAKREIEEELEDGLSEEDCRAIDKFLADHPNIKD